VLSKLDLLERAWLYRKHPIGINRGKAVSRVSDINMSNPLRFDLNVCYSFHGDIRR
jgi:hypothetical protein